MEGDDAIREDLTQHITDDVRDLLLSLRWILLCARNTQLTSCDDSLHP